ncbi:MAG: response regulator [Ignavibacteriaceae bacterium]
MGNNKILIVEDEAIIALEIEDRLLTMGYEVCGSASSGEKAILLAEKNNPDIILMDIKLKGDLSGIETANIIFEKFKIPSIYLTAFMDDSAAAKNNGTAKRQYLTKPIVEDELRKAIENTLDNIRLNQ